MDHKVSKDMISSGMTPSGEKTQADLGRTQYGSAPSPSSLMDAYKSIYEHHQKDENGNTIPHEGEELNEALPLIPLAVGAGGLATAAAGGKLFYDSIKGLPKKMRDDKKMKNKTTTTTSGYQVNDVDLFDLVKGKLIDEGCEEKEALKIMANMTKEEFDEVSEGLAGMALKTGMAVGGGVLLKKGLNKAKKSFDNYLNKQRDKGIGGNTRPGSDKIYYGK